MSVNHFAHYCQKHGYHSQKHCPCCTEVGRFISTSGLFDRARAVLTMLKFRR